MILHTCKSMCAFLCPCARVVWLFNSIFAVFIAHVKHFVLCILYEKCYTNKDWLIDQTITWAPNHGFDIRRSSSEKRVTLKTNCDII